LCGDDLLANTTTHCKRIRKPGGFIRATTGFPAEVMQLFCLYLFAYENCSFESVNFAFASPTHLHTPLDVRTELQVTWISDVLHY
jgi:hypothetical protein